MSAAQYEDLCDYEFVTSSGTAANDCVVLAYRKPASTPLSAFEMESWVIQIKPLPTDDRKTVVRYDYGKAGWLTGLWRSLEGPVYVSDIDGTLRVCRDFSKAGLEAWEEHKLDAQLAGVWGLSDTCVFTWGRSGNDEPMFQYDGRKWRQIPSPGNVSVLHGVSPDLVYAVGYDGLMARWDGHTWTPVSTGAQGNFTGLFMAGPDELYATTERGELWEGTSHGWAMRARWPEPLLAVACHQGEVWVAGGDEGLLRLKKGTNELECVKPNLEAKSFDARGILYVTARDFSGWMVEGMKVRGLDCKAFQKFCAQTPPMWQA